LERIYLRGDVGLRASVLGKLGELGVGVVVMSGRKGEATLLMHRPHNDAARRVAQYRCSTDSEFCLTQARLFVQLKLERERAFLAECMEREPMHRYVLGIGVKRIDATCRQLVEATQVGSLRGMEGAAAQAFFAAYQDLFPPELKFTGRNRRPPRDPVNATLSLGYTLLHAEAVLHLYGAGLDPFIGFLHELDFGRESLACDVIEPLRVGVDRFVLNLFRTEELRADHFSKVQEACLLGKTGRQRFYAAWQAAAADLRRELEHDISALCRRVDGAK
jgi:CRISPR-associated protein Cas1